MYYYWAYGLLLESEVFFPELMPVGTLEIPDIHIRMGAVPFIQTAESDFVSESLIVTPTAYKLSVEGVASYAAIAGNTIVIDPVHGHDPASLRLFCLSNVFAALLHQRRSIPMHCSGIIYKDQLILVCGSSGAGKSTTLSSLMQRGFEPFSDDVCVPFIDAAGEVQCYSSYPMIKHWITSVSILGLEHHGHAHRLRKGMEKFGFYFHDRFRTQFQKPSLVFFLERVPNLTSVILEAVKGIDRFVRLDDQAYRPEFLAFSALQKQHFALLSTLANQVEAFIVKRGDQENHIELLADLVEERIRQSL